MGSPAITITPDAPVSPQAVTITPDAPQAAPRGTMDSVKDFASSLWDKVNPVSALYGARDLTAHPIDALKADAKARDAVYQKAEDAFKKGDYAGGSAHLLYSFIPMLGPQLSEAGGDLQQGNYAKGAGASTGLGLSMAAPEVVPSVIAKMAPRAAMDALSKRMYQSALKPPPASYSTAEVANMVNTGLDNKIPISEAGASRLNGLVKDLQSKVKTQIQEGGPQAWPQPVPGRKLLPAPKIETPVPATDAARDLSLDAPYSPQAVLLRPQEFPPAPAKAPGVTIDPQDVVRRLDGMKQKFASQVNPEADLAAIDAAKEEFVRTHPDAIPAATAQDIKTGTYSQLRGKYGELSSATNEAQKALARGIKEELENQFPEIKGLNAREGQMINLDGALERAIRRTNNRDILSIGGKIVSAGAGTAIGGAAGGAEGGIAGSAGALILHHVLTDPVAQSKLAIALRSASNGSLTLDAARARALAYTDSLGNANAASSDKGDQSTN